jgi:hypothetical protein
MGLGLVLCLVTFIVVGIVIFQAQFAARKWRQVIKEGDNGALSELIDDTFDEWRRRRPARDRLLAEWNALQSVGLVAANHSAIRVSLLAEPAMTVTNGKPSQSLEVKTIGLRALIGTVERLMYEIPHVSFARVQVDVYTEYRSIVSGNDLICLMSCKIDREQVAHSDWDSNPVEEIAKDWPIEFSKNGRALDPELGALCCS